MKSSEVAVTQLMASEVDQLLEDLVEFQKEKLEIEAHIEDIVKRIDSCAEKTFQKGSKTFFGKEHKAKLNRRVNVSYPRPKGADHPLADLLEDFSDILANKVRIELKESGAKIENLLDKYPNISEDTLEDEVMTVEELLVLKLQKSRAVSVGKPSVTGIELNYDKEQ